MTVLPDEGLAYTLAGVKKKDPFADRRSLAQRLMLQGMDASPIQSPWQGAARLAQAVVGGYETYTADRDEKEAEKADSSKLALAMAETDPVKKIGLLPPHLAGPAMAQLAVKQAEVDRQRQGLQTAADSFGSSYSAKPPQTGAPTGNAGAAISGIESSGRYDIVGPPANAKGNRAYGKYQVLDSNIPAWTQEVLGKPMSPQEFLANPQAQDQVFNTKFNQYVQKYGSPEAASRAWFAGEGGMNNPNARDVLGTTVQGYGNKFAQAYGPGATAGGAPPAPPVTVQATPPGQPQPLTIEMTRQPIPQGSADQPPGMPPAPSPQGVAGPTMVAPTPPAIPDVPRPRPSEGQVAQYKQRLASGEFGTDAGAVNRARAALDAEVERDWGVQRDRAKMQFDQQMGDYRDARNRTAEAGEHDRREGIKKLEPPPPFKKLATDVRTAATAIDNFENVVKETGGGTFGALLNSPNDPQAQKLLGAFETMKAALRSEAFFNTGVLQPAEAKMLDDALLSPGSIRGFMANPQAYAEKLNQFRTFMDGKLGAAYQAYGLPQPEERFSRAAPAPAPTNRFVGPDGRAVTMQDIEETAKNRGMDPQAVIQRLQLRPVQ